MRAKLSNFFLTMDPASFWFGFAACAWLCLFAAALYWIVTTRRDLKAAKRHEEVVKKYGRHSIEAKENASASTQVFPAATAASRSDRPGRTDTTEIPVAKGSTASRRRA